MMRGTTMGTKTTKATTTIMYKNIFVAFDAS
jgi:hypothetical protein